MIVRIRNIQDTGKTALAVATCMELVAHHGYDWREWWTNVVVKREGVNCVDNKTLISVINKMVVKGVKHKIVLIDEADRVFPARFWHDREQTDALIGLWQDVKLFNWIIYTCHLGSSIDIILRGVAQIGIIPNYVKKDDKIDFTVFNALYHRIFEMSCPNVSETVFPYYERWTEAK